MGLLSSVVGRTAALLGGVVFLVGGAVTIAILAPALADGRWNGADALALVVGALSFVILGAFGATRERRR